MSSEEDSKFGKPMLWIGLYVALASAACMVAMTMDVIGSFRRSKFWIPSKFFAFNAAMLTTLAIATKIPSDINDLMPNPCDQLCKLSGILLVCIAMNHAMPSLGVMDGYVLLSNMIALGILVVSTTVNIWFQIHTKLIDSDPYSCYGNISYTVVMIFMYAILVSHAMSVSTVKLLLEKQFDSKHKEILGQVNPYSCGVSYNIVMTVSFEMLKEYVKKYWLMTLTSSPDYVLRTSGASFACSLSCCLMLSFLHFSFPVMCFDHKMIFHGNSVYKWSARVVLLVQILASLVGTVSSVLRMIQSRVGRDECGNFRSLFYIEQYRAQQHKSWKKKPLPFHIRNKRAKTIAYHAKAAAVALLIFFQRMVIFLTRLLHLIFFCIGAVFSWPLSFICRFISRYAKISSVSMSDEEDLSSYVLTLEGESDRTETARKWKDYPHRWLKEGQAGRPRKLYALLTKLPPSSSFVGFQSTAMSSNVNVVVGDCWSLRMATLGCIIYAAFHGTTHSKSLELLMETLDEGLPYIVFVDENHANACKEALETAKMVWQKLRIQVEWLDMPLKGLSQRKNIVDIIGYLQMNARNNAPTNEEMDPTNWSWDAMAAQSMAKITKSLLECQLCVSFKSLEAEVAATVRRCLENMPIAILNECSRGNYGSREEHVRLAARMLGEMQEILKLLEERRVDP